MSIIFKPIGIIHTPIKIKEEAPIQSARSEINGEVEVFPEYAEGLDGVEGFSHICLLYHLNQSDQAMSLHVNHFWMIKPMAFLPPVTHVVQMQLDYP